MKLFAKQKKRFRCKPPNIWAPRGTTGWAGVEDWIDVYTLLCIKRVTNETLLNSTGNSTQRCVVTSMERKPKQEEMCVCAWLAHGAVRQKLTM